MKSLIAAAAALLCSAPLVAQATHKVDASTVLTREDAATAARPRPERSLRLTAKSKVPNTRLANISCLQSAAGG